LEEDKLVALSAIASEFQRVGGDIYLAGLWRGTLPEGLMWMMHPCDNKGLKPRPSEYIAPSWSWASAEGVVGFLYGSEASRTKRDNVHAEILHCETTLKNEKLLTGQVVAGLLELRGPVRETRWTGTTLLEGVDTHSNPIGEVYMDAEEDKPEILWCLRIGATSGLILAPPSPSSKNFRRVGCFSISGTTDPASDCDDWFRGSDHRTVVII
jgi:hypothetical protein